MYKVYFEDGYPIVSIVVRASSIRDALHKVYLIVGKRDAYNKVYEIHQLNNF